MLSPHMTSIINSSEYQIYQRSLVDAEALPLESKVACALYVVKEVYTDAAWQRWANNWLDGVDRSIESGRAVIPNPITTALLAAAEDAVLATEVLTTGVQSASLRCTRAIAGTHEKGFIITDILAKHFICPHCHKPENQHLTNGKCLFGANTWEGINNAWRFNHAT